MGEPRAIWLYLKTGEAYHFNYVFGDIEQIELKKRFPIQFSKNTAHENSLKFISRLRNRISLFSE